MEHQNIEEGDTVIQFALEAGITSGDDCIQLASILRATSTITFDDTDADMLSDLRAIAWTFMALKIEHGSVDDIKHTM